MELSNAALSDIFELAQQVAESQIKLSEAAKNLNKSHGIKESSGRMTLVSVGRLRIGEVYKRAVTLQIVEYVLNRAKEEGGVTELGRVLKGLEAHVDYRRSGGVNVPGLEALLAKFSI